MSKYVTDAAREYAKMTKKSCTKDSSDLDQRIVEFETKDLKKRIDNFKFNEFDYDDYYRLGPAIYDSFIRFDKNNEQFVKYILMKYGSQIEHVKDDIYFEIVGPSDKIESEDGIALLEEMGIFKALDKNESIELYDEIVESDPDEENRRLMRRRD